MLAANLALVILLGWDFLLWATWIMVGNSPRTSGIHRSVTTEEIGAEGAPTPRSLDPGVGHWARRDEMLPCAPWRHVRRTTSPSLIFRGPHRGQLLSASPSSSSSTFPFPFFPFCALLGGLPLKPWYVVAELLAAADACGGSPFPGPMSSQFAMGTTVAKNSSTNLGGSFAGCAGGLGVVSSGASAALLAA